MIEDKVMIRQQPPFPQQPGPMRPLYPCPACRHVAVIEYFGQKKNGTKDGFGITAAVLLLIGFITVCFGGWILIGIGMIFGIIALCMPTYVDGELERFCQQCGHRWKI
jgi:hypothetical protein